MPLRCSLILKKYNIKVSDLRQMQQQFHQIYSKIQNNTCKNTFTIDIIKIKVYNTSNLIFT
jgi:hypothetical protein